MQSFQSQSFSSMNDSYFPSVLFNPDYQEQTSFKVEESNDFSNQWVLEYGLLSPPFDLQALPSTIDEAFLPYPSYPQQEQHFSSESTFFSLPPLTQNNTNFEGCALQADDYYIPRIYATLPTPLPSPTLSCQSSLYSDPKECYDFSMELDSPEAVQQSIFESSNSTLLDSPTPCLEEPEQASPMMQTPSIASPDDYTSYSDDLPRSNPAGAEGSCTPFVSKLAFLLRNADIYQDVIMWDTHGKSFIIAPSPKMTEEVLPNIFLHSSVAAFTRQLNTYGFKRLSRENLSATFSHSPDTTTPIKELSAWYHPHFNRAEPASLSLLTPKPSRARELHRKGKAMLTQSASGVTGSASAVKSAISKMKATKKKEKDLYK